MRLNVVRIKYLLSLLATAGAPKFTKPHRVIKPFLEVIRIISYCILRGVKSFCVLVLVSKVNRLDSVSGCIRINHNNNKRRRSLKYVHLSKYK